MSKIRINMISESEFTVQGHGVHTAYVEMTKALKRRKDTDIMTNTARPADIVHVHTLGFYALRKILRPGSKKIISAHIVSDSFIGSIRGAKWWRPIGELWLKFFYSRADLVLACSQTVQRELQESMKLKNVDLLYNSIDMSQYHSTAAQKAKARTNLKIKKNDFVVLGNGQVQPRKRLDTFIHVAEQMPDTTFIWVGGIPFGWLGAEYANMNTLVQNLPPNVTITGVVPLAEVKKYYQAADVFMLPAEQENHPMCVLEAAGAGLPIVLRDIPEYADTFKGDALMASTDEEFVRTITTLRDDKDARKQAKTGAKNIATRFDSSASADRLMNFYRELLQK